MHAFRSGASIAVHGESGGGRTTALWRLSAAPASDGRERLTLLGSAALTNVPFGHLATLATRLPELSAYTTDPLGALHTLGQRVAITPLSVLVDDAEYVDAESAAILTQLASVGTLQLVVAVREPRDLPTEFQRFLTHADTAQVTLGAIDITDAKTLLEAQLAQPVNASSVTKLYEEVQGDLAQLTRAADAAMRDDRFVSARGYLVLARKRTPGDTSDEQLTPEQRLTQAAAEYQTGDHARALSLLAPLIADGDAEARLLAGRIEVLTGDVGHGIELLTRQPGDSERFHAQSSLWRAHGGEPFDAGQFEAWAAETTFPAELRLGLTAAVIVHDCYAGDPAAGLERAFAALGSELWESATGSDAGALLYSLHLAVLCEGSHELGHAARFEGIDWGRLALDHGLFITSRAYVCAEYGMAAETLDLTEQVLALTEQGDPFGIAGFVAAAGAAGAAMLDDLERASELLDVYRSSSVHSGQLLHPESERIALAAILAVEGEDAAHAEFDLLVARARHEGHAFLVMRLEHEAWRLGLTNSPDALAAAAAGVTGQFAASLQLLAQTDSVEELASELLAHGRTLFAAEFLADAARAARDAENRVRAQALFAQSAELADQLPGVNTPRLGRVRVDPNLLTAREIEVSIRAAAGLTNTEIADELFLSHRTVEGHLQRAYAKLGVSDRHQLLPLPTDTGLPE